MHYFCDFVNLKHDFPSAYFCPNLRVESKEMFSYMPVSSGQTVQQRHNASPGIEIAGCCSVHARVWVGCQDTLLTPIKPDFSENPNTWYPLDLLCPHTYWQLRRSPAGQCCRTWLDGRHTAFFPLGSASPRSSPTVFFTRASTPFLRKSHPLLHSSQGLLDESHSGTAGHLW